MGVTLLERLGVRHVGETIGVLICKNYDVVEAMGVKMLARSQR